MTFTGWVWGTDAATLDALLSAFAAEPPQIGFANDEVLTPFQWRRSDAFAAVEDGTVELEPTPPIELLLSRPGLAPDYFLWSGYSFASAALREVLALPPEVVRYLPVDARHSTPDVIAQDYRNMTPVQVRPLIDLRQTAHERVPMQRRDGSIGEGVLLTPERRQYWRDDFAADVPLFRAAHSQAIIAGDALAERVLAAGMTGVAFQDVTSDRAQRELVLKKAAATG
ncbi:hypothetical protein SAMN06297144_3479 [Sphingomonas guangdongensis]|uniref:Immunity MXAN-0049 protein domain-containing protein n=1 Tax=Sphingomonas guangdongensis TaxID=1141890 RepID=A0A285R3J0_9SPHN|nr:hypothetical protein [Sphingomonas guangdongensis]SOB88328.1 hypothetical protein SAMN06297144_3479 [Sphingomonas guangdongensis]